MGRNRSSVWFSLIVLFLLGLVLAASLPAPSAAAPPQPRTIVEPQLLKTLAAKGQATFIVHLREKADLGPALRVPEKLARRQAVVDALQATAGRSQRELRLLLDELQAAGHVQAAQPLWITNAIVVTGDVEALKALAAQPEVERIRADHEHWLPEPLPTSAVVPSATVAWNLRLIGADRVWNELGITGRGVVVANMDSGVDWEHPALRPAYRGGPQGAHDYNWYDVTGTYPAAPDDGLGHGTHTMGILVGHNPQAAVQHIGVAPGARWMAVKVFDDRGRTTDSMLHQGFQWILAPTDRRGAAPDPSKAPDVLNSSWGASNIADPTFWDDVAALRAAGILPVFSGGNKGELGEGAVGTPAGYPHSFCAGAIDANELLAEWSSRGPSYWGEIKPDIAAPGVAVLSSLPNGEYEAWDGTSMAAPHAAGTAALLLAANPALTVDDLETFMTGTAYDLGQPGPDNGYGAGRLDAYAAVSWALGAGRLAGQVIVADTGLPLASAQVEGVSGNPGHAPSTGSGHSFRTASDARGAYAVAVPAGRYRVSAVAFGYAPQTHDGVEVVKGYGALRDFRLQPLPTGTVSGHVLELGDGPLGAVTIRAEGTPAETTAGDDGFYSLALPSGNYTLVASSAGHRLARATVNVVADQVTAQDFWLAPAPRLLLLDADGWVEDDITLYYRDALRRAGYLHDTRRITDVALVPTAAELAAYDVVIWVHPWSSPGYIDGLREDTAAVDALRGYLLGGGRLLLIGQDIGYWDGGKEYYASLLHAGYVQDDAFSQGVHGLAGDVLAGVELGFAAADAYKLLDAPDLVRAADARALPIAMYDLAGRVAALRIEDRGYRLLYLAFGLEGSGPGAMRAQTLAQAIAWLASPTLEKRMQPATVAPGGVLSVTLTLRNPLGVACQAALVDPLPAEMAYVEGSATGGATYDPATNAVRWQGALPPGGEVILTFAATVAEGLPGGTVIENRARLELPDVPPIEASAVAEVEAPNLARSEKTVEPVNVAPGGLLTCRVALRNSSTAAAPAVSLLDPLPPQVEFVEGSITGGAWYNGAERRIEWSGSLPAAAPGQPNYAWTDSDMPGGPTFAWADISASGTAVALGDDQWRGPFPVGFAFPFYGQTFTEFYLSSNGWLSFSLPSSSESSNDPLPNTGAPRNLVAIFWDDLNPGSGGQVRYLAESDRLVVSFLGVPRYSSGGPYTFQALLTPDGVITLQYLTMLGTRLNEATVGIQNADASQGLQIAYNQSYVHDGLAVRITPPQEAHLGEHVVTFQVQVAGDVPDNTPIRNEAVITADGLLVTRAATAMVRAANLSASQKRVSAAIAPPGSVLTYTLVLSNTGAGAAQVTVSDPLPAGVSFVEGSATGGAVYDAERNEVTWQGTLDAGAVWPLGFSVRLHPELAVGSVITNTATIADGVQPPLMRSAVITVVMPDLSPSGKAADRPWAVAGEVLTYTLTLVNRGLLTATQVSLVDPLPPELILLPETLSGGAIYDADSRQVRWWGDLPASAGNYTWLDSDMAGGPVFDWLDISASGTAVPLGDDQWAGPFPLGFAFPFYEETFTEFYLSSNGWLSFSRPASSDVSNARLPDPNEPRNLIAIFWDDLNPGSGGQVRYLAEGDRLVVSFLGVPRYSSGGPYTFQAILTPDGVITLQYLTMLGTRLNEATVGIQNADGTRGVTVAHNEPYVHDGLAVRLMPPAKPHEIGFQAQLAPDLASDTTVVNRAFLSDALGPTLVLSATVRVNQVDFSSSAVALTPALVRPGEALTCTVTLRNSGNVTGTVVAVLPVPPQTAYLPGSASGGAVFEEGLNEVRWQGEVAAGGEASFGFVVVVDRPLADGTLITAAAVINDAIHPPLARQATATVSAPDLSGSRKQAHAPWVRVGDVITYTIEVRNDGSAAALVTFSDPLPESMAYVEGSAWAGSGSALSYDEASRTLRWQGVVPPRSIALLRFSVVLQWFSGQPALGVIEVQNVAELDDGMGGIGWLCAGTEVRFYHLWLFPVMRDHEW
ncbi:MAG: S8 family serine peptidase [Anaerolineae bacterium]|nr:S8 family serine peptidase [Anaerolineae bacterium]